jgi:hypothetical protein
MFYWESDEFYCWPDLLDMLWLEDEALLLLFLKVIGFLETYPNANAEITKGGIFAILII